MLGLALAGDREDVVLELDVHVLLGQARQVGAEYEVIPGLDEVHRGDPPPQGARIAVPRRRRLEKRIEQPVHLVLNRAQLAYRLPTNQCHVTPPSYGTLSYSPAV